MTAGRLSVVVVTWNSADVLDATLSSLAEQLRDGDELIVVDNGSDDGTQARVRRLAYPTRLIELGTNGGFSAAANVGAEAASLGPSRAAQSRRPAPAGLADAIVEPLADDRGWAAWMGLVTFDRATRVNTVGNPVHFTGIVWAGGHGDPVTELVPGEVTTASGACLALPRATFRRLGGFPDRFFLYHEDVDLCMRLRLAGEAIGLQPKAVVDHDYEFEGRMKMRWLERNRWAFVIRCYPGPLLALLLPGLLLTELALIPVSIAGGWGGQKPLAILDGIRQLPWALRSRRQIQASRRISSAEFAALLTSDLDSPFFGRAGRSRVLRSGMRAYLRVVRLLLGGAGEPA